MVAIAKLLAAAPRPRITRFMNAAIHAPNPEIQQIAHGYLRLNVSAAPSVSPDPTAKVSRGLRSPDPGKRIEAAKTLGESDDAIRDSPILVDAIHDSNAEVRAAVVAALGDLNEYSNNPRNEREQDLGCVPALAISLTDSAPAVRAAAAHSLGQIRDLRNDGALSALRDALKDSDETVVLEATGAYGQIQDSGAVPNLIDIYYAKHANPRLNSAAVFALVFISDPRAQPIFIEALTNSSEQEQAVWGLLQTLKKRPNPDAVQPLLNLLATQTTYKVIHACGATKDSRAYEPLLLILKSPYPQIRGWGADALGDLGDKRAVPTLGRLLKDSDSSVRISTAHALSEMSDYQAPKELLDAVHDEDSTVQIWAAVAVGNSHDPKAVDALLAAASYNVSAITALGQSKDLRALVPLIGILQDKSRKPNDRAAAATSLGNLGDVRAVDPLIGVLNENEAALLMAAAQSLGKLHDKKAIEPLKQLIHRCESSPTCQNSVAAATFAYAALQKLGVTIGRQTTGSNPPPH